MSKIAVMGSLESCLPFGALGYDVYDVTQPDDAREILLRLVKEDTAILFITEQLAATLTAELQEYQSLLSPAIILIPGSEGSLGIGQKQIKTLVEKAVGMDIFKES